MFGLILFSLFGIATGLCTGLIPGLHINTISLIILGLYYASDFSPIPLCIFIVAMGITHSFVDFIPSLFFGCPDPSTCLSVQPGHRMLLKGDGYEALFLSVIGGVFGMLVLFVSFPLTFMAMPPLYQLIKPNMHYILIILVGYMLILEKKKILWGLFVFLVSGFYGLICMNAAMPQTYVFYDLIYMNSVINQNYVLFPVFTGLFGFSTLFLSYKSSVKIPKQKKDVDVKIFKGIKNSILGFIGGVLAGLLPGMGSSQSAILVQKFGRIKDLGEFILCLGTINTIAILFSIFALFLINNPRSGSAIIIQKILGEIAFKEVIIFLGVGLFATGIAATLTLLIGKRISVIVNKIDYKKIVLFIIIFLFVLVYYFTGIFGVFISLIGASIGLIPQLVGVKKSLALGCLLLPTILYFMGLSFTIIRFIGL